MKEINNFIRSITSNHFNPRYLLTPFSIAYFDVGGLRIKMVFIFGIRIIRIGLLPD
jgi:hypothetical protein